MAGGIDLQFVEIIAEWEVMHPHAKYGSFLELVEQVLQDYEFKELSFPKNFKNKPMSGWIIMKKANSEA